MALTIGAVPGGALTFNPEDGTGIITKADVVGDPKLGQASLIESPLVHYVDKVSYRQECAKDGLVQVARKTVERERNVKIAAQPESAKVLNSTTITGYALGGYWTVLLGAITELCAELDAGSAAAGPLTQVSVSGGKLTYNGNNGAGDVVIWTRD